MSLKAKIIEQLKEYVKAKGINLSNVRINKYSDKLDAIVDSEDGIKAEIEKLDSFLDFKELAALDDAKRNADKKAAEESDKTDDKTDDKPATTDTTDKDKKDEMPSWFKAHSESQNKIIETLTTKITAFEHGTVAQSRRQQLETKLKDAPEKFKARTLRDFDRLKLETDEDFTGYIADIEQDIAEEIQADAEAGAVGPRVSGIGGANGKEVKPASKIELDEVMNEIGI